MGKLAAIDICYDMAVNRLKYNYQEAAKLRRCSLDMEEAIV